MPVCTPPPTPEGMVHAEHDRDNWAYHMRFAVIMSAVNGNILEAVRLAGLLSRRDYSKPIEKSEKKPGPLD